MFNYYSEVLNNFLFQFRKIELILLSLIIAIIQAESAGGNKLLELSEEEEMKIFIHYLALAFVAFGIVVTVISVIALIELCARQESQLNLYDYTTCV